MTHFMHMDKWMNGVFISHSIKQIVIIKVALMIRSQKLHRYSLYYYDKNGDNLTSRM